MLLSKKVIIYFFIRPFTINDLLPLLHRRRSIVKDAINDPLIMGKYENPHLKRDLVDLQENETIVFGDPIRSKVLEGPLELTGNILKKLSRPARLNPNQTLLAAMSSALRTRKKLNEHDINFLTKLVKENEKKAD